MYVNVEDELYRNMKKVTTYPLDQSRLHPDQPNVLVDGHTLVTSAHKVLNTHRHCVTSHSPPSLHQLQLVQTKLQQNPHKDIMLPGACRMSLATLIDVYS